MSLTPGRYSGLWDVLPVNRSLRPAIPNFCTPSIEHLIQRRRHEQRANQTGVAPPHVTLNAIFMGMMPFMGIQVIALILLYVFPGIGLWLPNLLYAR